jgi:tripartite-type tricarboxylate transporter receptor subunit TctC
MSALCAGKETTMRWTTRYLFATLLIGPIWAAAADYPSAPVRIIHPYPGGIVDVGVRALGEQLAVKWKQPVIVEGKPGANELLAGDAVAKSPKDGLTLFVGTEATFVNNAFLYAKLPFDPTTDLLPVTALFEIRFGLVVRGDLPVATLKDFVELLKKDGASRSYASSGPGGPLHLAMEGFRRTAGFEMLHVPYRTLAQVTQDLLGGRVDAVFASVPYAMPFVQSGRMKLLAVTGDTRMKNAPDIPTFAELGYPGVDSKTLVGLAVPQGTPPEVVRKLHADIKSVLSSKAFAERFLTPNGFDAIGNEPQQFADALTAKRVPTQRLIKALDVRLD